MRQVVRRCYASTTTLYGVFVQLHRAHADNAATSALSSARALESHNLLLLAAPLPRFARIPMHALHDVDADTEADDAALDVDVRCERVRVRSMMIACVGHRRCERRRRHWRTVASRAHWRERTGALAAQASRCATSGF
jgi:hypothetical protein